MPLLIVVCQFSSVLTGGLVTRFDCKYFTKSVVQIIPTQVVFYSQGSIVWSNPKIIETIIYGCLNMCPNLAVTTDEALYLINMVFLGTTEIDKSLCWNDLLDADSLTFVESG